MRDPSPLRQSRLFAIFCTLAAPSHYQSKRTNTIIFNIRNNWKIFYYQKMHKSDNDNAWNAICRLNWTLLLTEVEAGVGCLPEKGIESQKSLRKVVKNVHEISGVPFSGCDSLWGSWSGDEMCTHGAGRKSVLLNKHIQPSTFAIMYTFQSLKRTRSSAAEAHKRRHQIQPKGVISV